MGAWKKFLDLIGIMQDEAAGDIPLDYRQKRQYRAVPLEDMDQILLMLAKRMLTDMIQEAQRAGQYAEGSKPHFAIVESLRQDEAVAKGILDACGLMADTTLWGERPVLESLGLASAEYVRALTEVDKALGLEEEPIK
jgi:hypothetical protein